MTYSITFTSKTGNTELLAEKIRAVLHEDTCVYYGAPTSEAAEAEIHFIGFWTDKGTCSEELACFLESLSGKKVFLFGTAGFGGAGAYFHQILERVSTYLNQSNTLIGTYMCQGKMPVSVRTRYESMADADSDKVQAQQQNFDRALTHPDSKDMELLENRIVNLIKEELLES